MDCSRSCRGEYIRELRDAWNGLLDELINSKLVMIYKRSCLDELKAVHIHELIHKFSSVKAKKEKILLRINEYE